MENIDMDFHHVKWTPDKISTIWNYYSQSDAHKELYFSKQVGALVYRYVKKHLKATSINQILDYGCGQGDMLRHILHLVKKNQRCYGIDFSDASVERVNREFKAFPNFKGAFHLEEAPNTIHDESIDLTFALEIVEHLDQGQLAEMKTTAYRVLRKGGYLVVTTPNREKIQANEVVCPDCRCVFHPWQHVRSWTPASLARSMEASGFRTIHVNETNFLIKNFHLATLFLHFFPRFKRNLIYIGKK